MNFQQSLTHFVPQVEAELQRLMAAPEDDLDDFYGMMHYHLGWLDENLQPVQTSGGKMLRPVFTLLCCQTAGGDPGQAMTAAATVELIHNFSLIHDDIEDDSLTRRGRRAVWAIWGKPQAINAGDSMFTLARNGLLKLRDCNVPLETVFEAIDRMDKTCLRLCRGQYLDMSFEQTLAVDLDAYLEMIGAKTGALLACAGYLGGLIATGDPARAQVYWDLGQALGLAFQIQDDWLGVWGKEDLTGKPTADDLRRRKKSLPVVYALSHEGAKADRFRELYRAPALTEANVSEAIALLEDLGAKAYTESLAGEYIDHAEAALEAVDVSEGDKAVLQEMAQFLIKRVY
jgi:geranylgeranyl diphosphate synthase type I